MTEPEFPLVKFARFIIKLYFCDEKSFKMYFLYLNLTVIIFR